MAADNFDPNEFLALEEAAAATPSAPSGDPAGEAFDPSAFLRDWQSPATGEDRPEYADGLSPDTAINKSPVDVLDRLKLATGNEAGKLNYLKSKFEDARVTRSGNYAVKQGDVWYQVDAKGLGDGDPWSRTKELVSDLADQAPLVLQGAAQGALIGAGTGALAGGVGAIPGALAGAATGATAALGFGLAGSAAEERVKKYMEENPGTTKAVALGTLGLAGVGLAKAAAGKAGLQAAGVGAATKALTTSLGRAVGTYEATPEEQLRDIGMEALLNFGGVQIAAGVKPTAQMIAQAGRTLSKAPEASRGLLKAALGKAAGVSPEHYDTLFENPQMVADAIKHSQVAAGASRLDGADRIVNKLTSDNINIVKDVAKNVQPAITHHWQGLEKQLIDKVDDRFAANVNEVVGAVRKDAVENGLLEMQRVTRLPSGQLRRTPLSPEEAAILLEKGAGARSIPGVEFAIKSRDSILKSAKAGASQNELATDPEAYGIMRKFLENIEDAFAGAKEGGGKAGLRQVMQMKKVVGDMTYAFKKRAEDSGLNAVVRKMADYGTRVNKVIEDGFDTYQKRTGVNLGDSWRNLNMRHSELKTVLEPLEQAVSRGNEQAYETLYNQLISRSGKNVVRKEGFDRAIQLLDAVGGRNFARGFEQAQQRLRINEAAKAFTPALGKGFSSLAVGGLAGGALMTGGANLPAAAALAATTSPAFQQSALFPAARAVNAVGAKAAEPAKLAVQAGLKALDFLKAQGTKGSSEILNDPRALNMFLQSVGATPAAYDEVRNTIFGSGSSNGN